MGELAKRRAARDLWISRGHLKAALAGAFLLSGVSFGLGYVTGIGTSPAPQRGPVVGFTEQVPGEDLVALLARVEANRAVLGGVESLTFPDELSKVPQLPVGPMPEEPLAQQAPPPLVLPEEPAPGPEVHIDGTADAAPELPSPPAGVYTLQVASVPSVETARAMADELAECTAGGEGCPAALEGLTPWVGAAIVDGELIYTVSLGGFASESAAVDALEGVLVLPETRSAEVVAIP